MHLHRAQVSASVPRSRSSAPAPCSLDKRTCSRGTQHSGECMSTQCEWTKTPPGVNQVHLHRARLTTEPAAEEPNTQVSASVPTSRSSAHAPCSLDHRICGRGNQHPNECISTQEYINAPAPFLLAHRTCGRGNQYSSECISTQCAEPTCGRGNQHSMSA